MRNSPSLFILLILISCGKTTHVDDHTKADNTIIEGKGIGSFKIHSTRANHVIDSLGKNYEEIRHKEYSVQLSYHDLGISFYYYPDDSTREIFAITFSQPFEGKTTKGITLGESTMEDVVKIYGEPDWTSCDNCDYWTNECEGIEFEVERDKSLPQFPLDEQVHLKKKIRAITVIEKGEFH